MSSVTHPEAAKKLTIARTKLLLSNGFFGMLALRLQLVEDTSIRTLAVDGRNIFYNPEFVMGLSLDLTCSAVAHEVMHCVFEHMSRRGDRSPKKWNYAGDYAINQILQDAGFEIGKGWLIHPNYKDMTADEIYSMLPDDPEGNDDSLCDIMPGETGSQDTVAAEWKIAAVQAATAMKNSGTLPGSLRRFVDEITETKVDWRAQLQRFVSTTAQDDYAWNRPNRKFLGMGMYMPSLYSEAMGPIAIAIDTSGSIDNETLQTFGAEIRAIVGAVRPSEIHVIYCDAEVNHVDTFSPNDHMEFIPHGGGGTDFRPPFAYLEEHGIQPHAFVYLTDMYGPFPEDPGFPTIWCSTSGVEGPFGETVHIEA